MTVSEIAVTPAVTAVSKGNLSEDRLAVVIGVLVVALAPFSLETGSSIDPVT